MCGGGFAEHHACQVDLKEALMGLFVAFVFLCPICTLFSHHTFPNLCSRGCFHEHICLMLVTDRAYAKALKNETAQWHVQRPLQRHGGSLNMVGMTLAHSDCGIRNAKTNVFSGLMIVLQFISGPQITVCSRSFHCCGSVMTDTCHIWECTYLLRPCTTVSIVQ